MASEATLARIKEACERIEASTQRKRTRDSFRALRRHVEKEPGWEPVPTAWEIPATELSAKAHGCPTPILLTEAGAPAGERIKAIPCGKWNCPVCGKKRCAEFTRRTLVGVRSWLEETYQEGDDAELLPHEWTLTFKVGSLSGDPRSREQMREARRCWNRLRRAIAEARRRQGLGPLVYVNVREYTKKGVPHFHLLVIGNPWPVSVPHRTQASSTLTKVQQKERGAYLARFGFGFVHTWEPVRDRKAFGRYLAEYVTKAASMQLPKHCPRYSASRGFAPPLKEWRTVRAKIPEVFMVENGPIAVGCPHPDGGIASIKLRGRFWKGEEWPRLLEALRWQLDEAREREAGRPLGELRYFSAMSRAGG